MSGFIRIIVLLCVLSAVACATINVSSPVNGSTVGSPAHFVGWANSAHPITGMRIYIDGVDSFATSAANIDTYLPLSAGWHTVWVKAWDSTGLLQQWGLAVAVGGSAASTTGGSASRTYTSIDQMSGWESCTYCAGSHPAQYGMNLNVSSPSLDGRAAQFFLGAGAPYANALWWKQLGGNDGATHFVYDLYFYLSNPQYAEALEFDVNQSVGGHRYIFGVECNIRDSGQWDVWDGGANIWRPTGIGCPMPAAYTWHHLIEEFQRDTSGHVTYVAITLDGVKHYVNRTYWSPPNGGSEVNVAFQMDGDYAQHQYSALLDQVKLTSW